MIYFRGATEDDAADISALMMSFVPELTEDPGGRGADELLRTLSVDAVRSSLLSGHFRFHVAPLEHSLSAVAAMRDHTHLFFLFVARNVQRQGIAKRLWDILKAEARSNGHAGPYTVNASIKSVPIYHRLGFRENGAVLRRHGVAFQPMSTSPDLRES